MAMWRPPGDCWERFGGLWGCFLESCLVALPGSVSGLLRKLVARFGTQTAVLPCSRLRKTKPTTDPNDHFTLKCGPALEGHFWQQIPASKKASATVGSYREIAQVTTWSWSRYAATCHTAPSFPVASTGSIRECIGEIGNRRRSRKIPNKMRETPVRPCHSELLIWSRFGGPYLVPQRGATGPPLWDPFCVLSHQEIDI